MTATPAPKFSPSDPTRYSNSGTEHGHQVALFAAIAQLVPIVPELGLLFAIPNGGTRGGDKRSAMIAGAGMKAEGVKTGVSDLMLPVARWGFHGLFIEMKKPGGTESKEQVAFGAAVTENGYWYQCCSHWIDALALLSNYLQFVMPSSLDWNPDALASLLAHCHQAKK